jgi:hypothetical protein
MTWAECLAHIEAGHAVWMRANEHESLGEWTAALAVTALMFAALLAPLCQWAYSRRMQRYMSMRELGDAPARWWRPSAAARRAPEAGAAAPAAPGMLAAVARQRERRLRRASWAAFIVFAVLGAAAIVFFDDQSAFDVAAVVVFVVLSALSAAWVNVRPFAHPALLCLAPAGLMAVGWASVLAAGGDADTRAGSSLVALLALAALHRTLRAVLGPLLAIGLGAAFGWALSDWAPVPIEQCALGGRRLEDSIAGSGGATLLALALPLGGGWLGLALLRGLLRLVARGWMSDLSLAVFFALFVTAGLVIAFADGPRAAAGPLLAYFALWLGATLAAYALVLWRQPAPMAARSLLVLRVFSRDGRAERMLDALQSHWRYAGPVLQIGGPDLARLNLDLHEFVAFVGQRSHELLMPQGVSDEAFAASLDTAMDAEGRFRVNEVFCFDSSWRTMVERLMQRADAVVLDLRGFGPGRDGTTHEVQRLAALGLLRHAVAVYDDDTDWDHFDATARAAGARPDIALKVDASQADAQQRCFDALVAMAERPPGRG